jgi:chromosome segregation ATPase
MDELLQKLLESELLTEDTKTELKEAFDAKLEELKEAQREEIETEVKATLAEKYAEDKEALIDALDSKLEESVEAEFEELREDIERFRDLEAEYAQKLVEARKEMADTVKADMKNVLEALDAYVEMFLASEIEELKESIEEVRKEEHGRRVLEVIGEEYRRLFTDEDDLQNELAALSEERDRVQSELREAQERLKTKERNEKMEEVLESLHGRAREVMEAILQNVPTEKLEEGYKRYIDRVLHESVDSKDSEKDDKVLAEGEETPLNEGNTDDLKVATGDKEPLGEDVSDDTDSDKKKLDENWVARLKLLSGQTE